MKYSKRRFIASVESLDQRCLLNGAVHPLHAPVVSVAAVSQRHTSMADRVAALETALTSHESRITALETKVTAQDSRIATLESQVAGLTSQFATLQTQIATLQNQVVALQAQQQSQLPALTTNSGQKFLIIGQTLSNVVNVTYNTNSVSLVDSNGVPIQTYNGQTVVTYTDTHGKNIGFSISTTYGFASSLQPFYSYPITGQYGSGTYTVPFGPQLDTSNNSYRVDVPTSIDNNGVYTAYAFNYDLNREVVLQFAFA